MADPITPPTETPNGGDNGGNNNGGGEDKNKPNPISPEEHQKELDRVAAKTRQEEKEKAEKLIEERIKKEREEWEKNAKLTQEEKDKKAREQQEKEIADRELKITLRENRSEALEIFATDKLPTKLVDLVVDANKEAQTAKIESFKASWNEALKTAVADALKGEAPPDPAGNDKGGDNDAPAPKNFL